MRKFDYLLIWLLALLFIFSGLVKLNDPVGTQIKLEEYFDVFAHDVASVSGWLSQFFRGLTPLALGFSVLLSLLEVVLAVMLLTGFYRKQALALLLAMIIFFTFLTFYSWYFNKVTDCGCFGDALKLSPLQSFLKDIFLFVVLLYLYARRKKLKDNKKRTPAIATLLSLVVSLGIAAYALRYEPPLDFRAYRIGNHIPSLMKPSAPLEYEYILEKEGRLYHLADYPSDTTFRFVDMKLRNPEALPKITDFRVYLNDHDITDSLFRGRWLWIIIHDIERKEKLHEQLLSRADLFEALQAADIKPIILTAAALHDLSQLLHDAVPGIAMASVDHTVAKTIVRSNPGYVLVDDGLIKGKWAAAALPHSMLNIVKKLY